MLSLHALFLGHRYYWERLSIFVTITSEALPHRTDGNGNLCVCAQDCCESDNIPSAV